MSIEIASAILRDRIRSYGAQVPGCVFYVIRNGQPFADGSFGWARMPGASDGELAMSATSLVHVGSIGKFFTAVAILRLIQEWNAIIDTPLSPQPGGGVILPPMPNNEKRLWQTVLASGAKIGPNTAMYPLVEPYLLKTLIAGYRARPTNNKFPGTNVETITLLQLLNHTSDVARHGNEWPDYDEADLGGLTRNEVDYEPPDSWPALFRLAHIATAMLRRNATPPPGTAPNSNKYNNCAYVVLGAVIQAVTGRKYTDWTRQRLFPEARFNDLDRRPIAGARAARHYALQGGTFQFGNRHPDYVNFGGHGGWYVSATAFCDWVDALMQKTPVAGKPILDDPQQLITGMLGLDWNFNVSRLKGVSKNGAASPGGGIAKAQFLYFQGYGNERVCAFVHANAEIDTQALLADGMEALRPLLAQRSGPIPVATTATTATAGLRQAIYWNNAAGGLGSASQTAAVQLRNVQIGGGATRQRTDLFGAGAFPNSRTPNSVGMVELRGLMRVDTAGSYKFRLSSDDGSLLWLNEELMVDHDGNHALTSKESAAVQLAAGNHPIRVYWYNAGFGGSLFLEWQAPGASGYAEIPVANFTTGA